MNNRSDTSPLSSSPTIPIGTDDMRKRMGEILDCVSLRGDEFLIERKHKAMAVLMPVEKHKVLTGIARKFALELLHREENALIQEKIDMLADQAKHASREVHG